MWIGFKWLAQEVPTHCQVDCQSFLGLSYQWFTTTQLPGHLKISCKKMRTNFGDELANELLRCGMKFLLRVLKAWDRRSIAFWGIFNIIALMAQIHGLPVPVLRYDQSKLVEFHVDDVTGEVDLEKSKPMIGMHLQQAIKSVNTYTDPIFAAGDAILHLLLEMPGRLQNTQRAKPFARMTTNAVCSA